MIISFIAFFLLFVLVGVLSARKSRGTENDYYLASQSVSPWLVGLSAVATNNSGYMFIGVIGYTYSTGLAAMWLMIGWITGDVLGSQYIHRNLRNASTDPNNSSYIGVLSRWQGLPMVRFQKLAAILAFIFLMAYASAQLIAGSKALIALLDWPHYAGAVIGAVLVLVYCLAGGIRASIWTDAAQSIVMVFAMSLLLVTALVSLGGVGESLNQLHQVEHFMDWFPKDLYFPGALGGLLFVIGWAVAGFSVVGQPHIMIRFMALSDSNLMNRARTWYYAWFIVFYCMATAVGLLSRIMLPEVDTFDAELALPTMALELLPPILVGLILAGIFAATMSTADSLVLSCSAIVTGDLRRKPSSLWHAKVATIAVTVGALTWALLNKQSVFNLVVMSWSTLGSAFVPVLILLVMKQQFNEKTAIGILIVGAGVALAWRGFGFHAAVYEGLPAVIAALLSYPIIKKCFPDPAIASQ